MVTSSRSIEINRPRAEVFAYCTNVEKVPEWQANILSSAGVPGMPAGSELVFQTTFLGVRSEFRIEMVENDGQGHTVARSVRGPVNFETTYDYQERGPNKCRVVIIVKIEAGTIYRLAEPALQAMSDAVIEADLKMLKTILENLNEQDFPARRP